jgi:type II secretory pathway component GspD/PulD (secretin)
MFVQTTPGRSRNQPPPVIVGNDMLNSLMVMAAPTDFSAIQAAVKELDIPKAQETNPFEMVQVPPGANILEIAMTAQETVNNSAEALFARAGGRSGGQPPRVLATPDKRTGMVILAGSSELFPQTRKIIESLSSLGPSGRPVTKIIKPSNITVDDIQRLIDQLTEQGASSGGSGRRSSGARRSSGPSSSSSGSSRPATPARRSDGK